MRLRRLIGLVVVLIHRGRRGQTRVTVPRRCGRVGGSRTRSVTHESRSLMSSHFSKRTLATQSLIAAAAVKRV